MVGLAAGTWGTASAHAAPVTGGSLVASRFVTGNPVTAAPGRTKMDAGAYT